MIHKSYKANSNSARERGVGEFFNNIRQNLPFDAQQISVEAGIVALVASLRECAAMPMGGPGDHPLTDLLFHGKHPFPADMEEMLFRLHRTHPENLYWSDDLDLWAWSQGRNLEAGRAALRAKLEGPDPNRHLIR